MQSNKTYLYIYYLRIKIDDVSFIRRSEMWLVSKQSHAVKNTSPFRSMVAFSHHNIPTFSLGTSDSKRTHHPQKITSLSQFPTVPSFFHPQTQWFSLEVPQIFPGIRDLKVIWTVRWVFTWIFTTCFSREHNFCQVLELSMSKGLSLFPQHGDGLSFAHLFSAVQQRCNKCVHKHKKRCKIFLQWEYGHASRELQLYYNAADIKM